MTSEVEQSLRRVSFNMWYITKEYWKCCSTVIVNYQTSEYRIPTSSYIQVITKEELRDFSV